jgi:hypothetical protein
MTSTTNHLAQPFANIFHTSASYLSAIRQSFAIIMPFICKLLPTNSFAYFCKFMQKKTSKQKLLKKNAKAYQTIQGHSSPTLYSSVADPDPGSGAFLTP